LIDCETFREIQNQQPGIYTFLIKTIIALYKKMIL